MQSMSGVSASPPPVCSSSLKPSSGLSSFSLPSQFPQSFLPSIRKTQGLRGFHRTVRIQCSSSGTPGPGSGENESKAVLDAFFLGKAFAEALNERIGSTVGEVLSVIGQWQAEQQKQALDFQEEVLHRARRAKEKAALETIEDQGINSTPLTTSTESSVPVVSPSPLEPGKYDPLQGVSKD